jgi:hypothetical protein
MIDVFREFGMVLGAVRSSQDNGIAGVITALTRAEGTAAHGYPHSPALVLGADAARNLSDVVHLLCVLHGRHPGVIDLAAARAGGDMRGLFRDAVDAFADERAYLTKLVVAAGPLPSTPGQAESEAAVQGQHHALEMLASSDRTGCAFGAAAALLLDWTAIRQVLDVAALRFGIDVPANQLPQAAAIEAAALGLPATAERAISFGVQQLLVQHRGLWDLLEAREVARRHH